MDASIAVLALAMALFVGSHLLLAWPGVRTPIVARLGERGFRALYSVAALATITAAVMSYNAAPFVEVWQPLLGLMHLAAPLTLGAVLLVVGGLTSPNPQAIGGERPELLSGAPRGFVAITRHPLMWGFGLWGIAHLLANGDLAGMLLFGGIATLAFVGSAAQDAKKRHLLGPAWEGFASRTSYLPFAAAISGRTRLTLAGLGWWRLALGIAVYAALFALHPALFGVSALPF